MRIYNLVHFFSFFFIYNILFILDYFSHSVNVQLIKTKTWCHHQFYDLLLLHYYYSYCLIYYLVFIDHKFQFVKKSTNLKTKWFEIIKSRSKSSHSNKLFQSPFYCDTNNPTKIYKKQKTKTKRKKRSSLFQSSSLCNSPLSRRIPSSVAPPTKAPLFSLIVKQILVLFLFLC
jgi:hypothetical protein